MKWNTCSERNYVFAAMLALFLLPVISYAQKTDSLRKILLAKSTPDTTRVLVNAELAWEFKNRNTNVDSIIFYAEQGMALANAIHFRQGAALCSMHVGIALILRDEYAPAVVNLNGALAYFETLPATKELNEIYHNLGLNYYMQTRFDSALANFELSRTAAAAIDNKSRLARAHYYLADIHNDMGTFAPALQHYLAALDLYEKGGKKNAASNCLTNIATVYAQLKDYKNARLYVDKSLKEFSRSTNVQEVYQNYANIGIVYSMMGDYDQALTLFRKGVALTDSLGDGYWNTVFLVNIAEVYTSSDKPELALAAYRQVLARNEKTQEVNFTLSAHSGMGRILYRQGKKQEGITHLTEAFRLMKENRLKRLIMETALELSKMYEQDGDYKRALEYNRVYNTYNDSLFNENNYKKIQQLQFDYELAKKQQQITQLEKKKEIQKEKNEKQRIVSWSLAGAMILLSIVIVVMWRSRLYEKRSKAEILNQNHEILQQAAKLEELNSFKDKTFSVLSHDLRGPINSITAAIQMFNDKDISPEEYAEMKPEINAQLNSLNLLLDNVLLWAKTHIKEGKAVSPSKTDLYQLVLQNIDLLKDAADRKQHTLNNNISEAVFAFCDAGHIDIVIRNLIMNAIKYTGNGGTITLDAVAGGGKVSLSVTDTGVGMNQQQLAELFAAKSGRNTYGTAGETGIGLGLLLCHEFVTANNGTIAVCSTPGKGSTFTITLPAA